MAKATLPLKEDDKQFISIDRDEIEEIIPDADFRFSLITMKDGHKYFVCGTLDEINQQFE